MVSLASSQSDSLSGFLNLTPRLPSLLRARSLRSSTLNRLSALITFTASSTTPAHCLGWPPSAGSSAGDARHFRQGFLVEKLARRREAGKP